MEVRGCPSGRWSVTEDAAGRRGACDGAGRLCGGRLTPEDFRARGPEGEGGAAAGEGPPKDVHSPRG